MRLWLKLLPLESIACYFSSASRLAIHFFRYLFIGYLFVYWYPETFYINWFFRNFDFLLVGADHTMFGFQPSLYFAQVFLQHWFYELMNLGYLFFYHFDLHLSLFLFLLIRNSFINISVKNNNQILHFCQQKKMNELTIC